jgi:outer membrane protein W
MTFRAQQVLDAANALCNPAEFGESLSYTPSGSSAVTVRALVERPQKGADAQDNNRLERAVVVTVSKSASLGVASVTVGGDKVAVEVPIGATSQNYRVTELLYEDDAVFRLRAVR